MKAYSSSISQIAFVYLQPFRRNSLLKWASLIWFAQQKVLSYMIQKFMICN